jgi:RluA family pseudouridine synthase
VHVPPYAEAQAVHRLDRDTSGVLLIAKNASICAAIGNDIGTGKVQKIYCAVVTGSPVPQEIDKPLGKDIHSAISYKFRVDQNGKPAVTHIIACQTVGEHHALVTLQPVTGRTHQIRLHLAAIGAPIVGDKLYGLTEEEYVQWRNDQSLFSGKLGFHRHALHCESLTFIHPITKKEIFISAEIPADMQGLITRLSATQ